MIRFSGSIIITLCRGNISDTDLQETVGLRTTVPVPSTSQQGNREHTEYQYVTCSSSWLLNIIHIHYINFTVAITVTSSLKICLMYLTSQSKTIYRRPLTEAYMIGMYIRLYSIIIESMASIYLCNIMYIMYIYLLLMSILEPFYKNMPKKFVLRTSNELILDDHTFLMTQSPQFKRQPFVQEKP